MVMELKQITMYSDMCNLQNTCKVVYFCITATMTHSRTKNFFAAFFLAAVNLVFAFINAIAFKLKCGKCKKNI